MCLWGKGLTLPLVSYHGTRGPASCACGGSSCLLATWTRKAEDVPQQRALAACRCAAHTADGRQRLSLAVWALVQSEDLREEKGKSWLN